MLSTLSHYQGIVHNHLQHKFAHVFSQFPQINQWQPDAYRRLEDLSLRGKAIRGALILLTEELLTGLISPAAKDAAAALELFQTSILAHDDFIDHDKKRRGIASLPEQYRQVASEKGYTEADHVGDSLSLCVGDIGFFLSYYLLSGLETDSEIRQKIIRTVSQDYTLIGAAEMQDVAFASQKTMPSEEEVLALYRYKTARYTFSLPFMIGSLLAKEDDAVVTHLSKLGEDIGIVFQIHDDELTLSGDEKIVGKPVGNDIRENKKTLHRIFLEALSNDEQKKLIHELFGNPNITPDDLIKTQELLKQTGTYDRIEKVKQSYIANITASLEHIQNPKLKTALNQLYEYVTTRES